MTKLSVVCTKFAAFHRNTLRGFASLRLRSCTWKSTKLPCTSKARSAGSECRRDPS